MITVEKRDRVRDAQGKPRQRWVVLDDGLVYDSYDTEDEAKAAAHTIIEDDKIGAFIDDQLDSLYRTLWIHFAIPGPTARKRVKERVSE